MVTPWEDAHFIGGHPVLDLANTVFDRAHPVEDNELLKTPSDVLAWCARAGMDGTPPPSDDLVMRVRAVREDAWAVFDAVARRAAVPAQPLGALLERAGAGVRAGLVSPENPTAAGSIPAGLALLAVQALYTLPPDRVRTCGRCGWLFLDSSRGGRRRWCSMSTCGNREKANRHRRVERVTRRPAASGA